MLTDSMLDIYICGAKGDTFNKMFYLRDVGSVFIGTCYFYLISKRKSVLMIWVMLFINAPALHPSRINCYYRTKLTNEDMLQF